MYNHTEWKYPIELYVTSKHSFQEAKALLKQIAELRLPSYSTALLLGNKRDLDQA
ncbi:hypothetical protein PV325_004414, partial [Microctonus aethiopoides]